MKPLVLAVTLAAVLGAVGASPAAADDKFGVRVGRYTEIDDTFVGAEYLAGLSHSIFFNPNVEYVFANDLNYLTLNADFHYDFRTHSRTYVWLGAGLGLVRLDARGPGNSDTEAAANFLGGVGLRTGSLIPYLQAKVIAKDNTEFTVALGLRF